MTTLSIIIVNYNVKHFLELSLQSVARACEGLETETFVVDNASSDDSVEMVKTKFPWVNLIVSNENLGFSKGNNLALQKVTGKYILLLNPDTVVGEDTFKRCIDFMENHSNAGAIGIKMIDGTGEFLPESKRGFPSPDVAFYKAFGLSRIFPRSKKFNQYHLGYLNKDNNHKIDVLSGAFMFIRKEALDKAGLLDEAFFMYGEDIDLSYRIKQAGFENYYLAEPEIVHYKGESTKKGSLNYVKVFYQAMIIFVKKHFKGGKAKLLVGLLQLAIFFRALLTLLSNLLKKLTWPIIDTVLLLIGLYLIKDYWQYVTGKTYNQLYTQFNIPLYTIVWVLSIFFSGGYDKPVRLFKIIRGIVIGTIVISAIYGFLPEQFRASRAMIPIGALWSAVFLLGSRFAWQFIRHGNFDVSGSEGKRLIIVGNEEEVSRTLQLMNRVKAGDEFVGFVSEKPSTSNDYLGNVSELIHIADTFNIDEIIFCAKDVLHKNVMEWMQRLGTKVSYKIVPEKSDSIIGSNSKNTSGDLYALDIHYNLNTYMSKRNKRVFDILSSLVLLFSLPLNIWFVNRKMSFIGNIFQVLFGRKTWVGYSPQKNSLPTIKNNVVPAYRQHIKDIKTDHIEKLNLLYAKEYRTSLDLKWLTTNFKYLGN